MITTYPFMGTGRRSAAKVKVKTFRGVGQQRTGGVFCGKGKTKKHIGECG